MYILEPPSPYLLEEKNEKGNKKGGKSMRKIKLN
jgi:hypothetical protein